MSDVRVGLIGAGVMGIIHAENITSRGSGATLAAIADPFADEARELASALGVERVYADYNEMMADGGLDAVVVCSPGETHGDAIEAAAAHGLHVFTEKPLERDLGRADLAVAAMERAAVKLMVAFNRRFDPSVRAAYDAVRTGDFGKVLTVHVVARDPVRESGAKPAGDLFLDTTIHDLDTACWMVGEEPQEVHAIGGSAGGLDDPDFAIVVLRFPGGAVATIDNNRLSLYGYDQRVEVCGTGGMVATDNERLHKASVSTPSGVMRARPKAFFSDRYVASYLEEMRQFIECIRNDTASPADGHAGRRALVLALAADLSYREGRPVAPGEIG